ncbi:hypothetical protein [Rhodoblastus sp.]|uniref:hypothetical protein n=1 Tax=Rhodoblastus sp. TaxID=1962975 RepID=UPI003FD6D8DB
MTDRPDQNLNPIELSLDAALQLEALAQGGREGAPKFAQLIAVLKAPKPTYSGTSTVSMLTDVRSAPLVRKAILRGSPSKPEANAQMVNFLDGLVEAVQKNDLEYIKLAKKFCLALNEQLLAKEYNSLVERQTRFRHHARAGNVR